MMAARVQSADAVESLHLTLGNGDKLALFCWQPKAVLLPSELSIAERAVLVWLLEGATNADIAQQRGTSTRTVAKQVRAIFGKLQVDSRSELLARYSTAHQREQGRSRRRAPRNFRSGRQRIDPVGIVEQMYRCEPDESKWLQGISSAVCATLPGISGFAYSLQLARCGAVVLGTSSYGDMPDWGHILNHYRRMPSDMTRTLHLPSPAFQLKSERMRRLLQLDEHYREDAIRLVRQSDGDDMAGLMGGDGQDLFVVIGRVLRKRMPPELRTRRLMEKIGRHLSTACALRRTLGQDTHTLADAGSLAVLTPDGGLVQRGVGMSWSEVPSLIELVKKVQHLRGRLRHENALQALSLWEDMLASKWVLLEHAENDGRRWILVRNNPLGRRDPLALSEQESLVAAYVARGRSNKWIGFELGLSEATVASHLTNAQRKLGTPNRREFLRLANGFIERAESRC